MEEEIESCEACGAESAAWELGADPAAYIAQLTAERDRYKTALERIEKTDPAVPDSTGPIEACEGCTEMIEIAANALKPKEAK